MNRNGSYLASVNNYSMNKKWHFGPIPRPRGQIQLWISSYRLLLVCIGNINTKYVNTALMMQLCDSSGWLHNYQDKMVCKHCKKTLIYKCSKSIVNHETSIVSWSHHAINQSLHSTQHQYETHPPLVTTGCFKNFIILTNS